MEFINFLWPHISDHPYAFLFIGMILGGETFLLPAVYLASRGLMDFPLLMLVAVAATISSDTVWYIIGRTFPLSKILSWKRFMKKREAYTKIFEGFQLHSQKLLFISKFVYGSRTIVQILAGSIKMPFLRYSAVNLAGIMSYLISIFLLALFARESLASFNDLSYNIYISIGVFIILIIIFHLCLKKWLSKKFSASSSQPGTKNEQ